MNNSEFLQVLTQAQKIGLETSGDLAELFRVCKLKNNREKINGLNDIFCRDWWEYSALVEYVKGR